VTLALSEVSPSFSRTLYEPLEQSLNDYITQIASNTSPLKKLFSLSICCECVFSAGHFNSAFMLQNVNAFVFSSAERSCCISSRLPHSANRWLSWHSVYSIFKLTHIFGLLLFPIHIWGFKQKRERRSGKKHTCARRALVSLLLRRVWMTELPTPNIPSTTSGVDAEQQNVTFFLM